MQKYIVTLTLKSHFIHTFKVQAASAAQALIKAKRNRTVRTSFSNPIIAETVVPA